ncbi:MAG: hypothetical protein Kow001_02260 [Acidobacteriota bacterium]
MAGSGRVTVSFFEVGEEATGPGRFAVRETLATGPLSGGFEAEGEA